MAWAHNYAFSTAPPLEEQPIEKQIAYFLLVLMVIVKIETKIIPLTEEAINLTQQLMRGFQQEGNPQVHRFLPLPRVVRPENNLPPPQNNILQPA
ncbi:MAG: hypothetical protein K2Q33_00550 [Gammaproteobacteria bacterium]|nr:hypothetical protein [Gammaproteobacteria bacterium]